MCYNIEVPKRSGSSTTVNKENYIKIEGEEIKYENPNLLEPLVFFLITKHANPRKALHSTAKLLGNE